MKRFGMVCLLVAALLAGCAGHEARQQRLAAEFRHPFIAVANGQRHFVASYNDLTLIMQGEPGEVQTFILGELVHSQYNRNLGRMFAGFGYREVEGQMLDAQSDADAGAVGQAGKQLYSQTFTNAPIISDHNREALKNLGFQIWRVFH